MPLNATLFWRLLACAGYERFYKNNSEAFDLPQLGWRIRDGLLPVPTFATAPFSRFDAAAHPFLFCLYFFA